MRRRVTRLLRTPDTYIVLLSAVSLILIGPLRSAFAAFPLVLFLSTLSLFIVPGVVLSRWLFDEHLSTLAMMPVSFAISAGIFGALGVPFLILHTSLVHYLWIAGAIVSGSLMVVVFGMLRRKSPTGTSLPMISSFSWLWIPFLLLTAILAYVSTARVEAILADMWVYLAWVREFLNADKLALHEPYFGNEIGTFSRAKINGWLLEQAALSKVSGIDPIELILGYLRPTLVVMSLLAFYALARTFFKSESAALLAGSLYALFFLIDLHPTVVSFGGEFIGRVAEDKFVARFLFLPIALIFVFFFLENRKLRYLVGFTFLCWVVVAIHPVGLAIIGLCTAGFGLVHLAINWRKKRSGSGQRAWEPPSLASSSLPSCTFWRRATPSSPCCCPPT